MIERALGLIVLIFLFMISFLLTFYTKRTIYQFLCILLIMVLTGIAYLYLNAEFLATIQIIVYVGAILVMFLFTLLLFPEVEEIKISEIKELRYRTYLPLGFFLGLILLSLFKGVPEKYSVKGIYFDAEMVSLLLFNEYTLVIYLLAFILTFPMVALYIFLRD